MAEVSAFRNMFGFLEKLGVFDVILPFLLVFTIIFAVLEKTKVLGLETVNDKKVARKNLNAMVAFVAAFLVIASAQLVSIINEVVANVVLVSILSICFLMLVGTFYGDAEFKFKEGSTWFKALTLLMFIAIVIIFLNAFFGAK